MKKLTNEEIDKRLLNRSIRRKGNYINNNIPISFECLIKDCNYEWLATYSNINGGKGCPKCVGHIKLTDAIVDERLKDRNIERIGNVIAAKIAILFRCKIEECKYEWKATPDNISQGSGCPACSNHIPLTNKIIDDYLELFKKTFIRKGHCQGAHIPIEFHCVVISCQYSWLASPASIKNNNSGCPKCVGNISLTNEQVDDRLKNRNIKRIDDYQGIDCPIRFQCSIENCMYNWKTKPDHILNSKSGCPKCVRFKNEKLVGTILERYKFYFEIQKPIKMINKKSFRVDYYLPQLNTIIEYNGRQHYEFCCFNGMDKNLAESEFIKQQERDKNLQLFCDQNNIRLIWIDGREYTNSKLENYLIDVIIPTLKLYSLDQ